MLRHVRKNNKHVPGRVRSDFLKYSFYASQRIVNLCPMRVRQQYFEFNLLFLQMIPRRVAAADICVSLLFQLNSKKQLRLFWGRVLFL